MPTSDIEDMLPSSNDDLNQYKPIVKNLYTFVIENCGNPQIKKLFEKKLQRLSRENSMQVKKSILVKTYRDMLSKNEIAKSDLFLKYIQKKPVRNTSGVNPITLMYSPYPNGNNFTCRFKCKYCQTTLNTQKVMDLKHRLLLEAFKIISRQSVK